MSSNEELYYIQNRGPVGNCVQWWRVGGNGYTCDLRQRRKFVRNDRGQIVGQLQEDR